MIPLQPRSNTLILCYPDGKNEPLDVQGLLSHLIIEPRDADAMLDSWVLEKVIESVVRHLREDLKKERVPLAEFMEWVGTLLKEYLKDATPIHGMVSSGLDLFETVQECGAGFELEFFPTLRRILIEKSKLAPSQSSPSLCRMQIQITGLRRCVKFLTGRRRWSKRCSETRDEIVDFIRREAARTGASDLALAVLS